MRNSALRRATVLMSAGVMVILMTGAASAEPSHHSGVRGIAATLAKLHARAAVRSDGDGSGEQDGDSLEAEDQAEQYSNERSAPAASVSAAALLAARAAAAKLPVSQAHVSEVTDQSYAAEPAGYTDPAESNEGAGFGLVSGRSTALAVDGANYYLGTADGGVWKSTNAGKTWLSIWDGQASLSIGALLIGPNHSLWVGTGEANTSSDSYRGVGVYRSTNGGASFTRVGGTELIDRQTFRLVDDHAGHVYVATSKGLWRHSDSTTTGRWSVVLKPDPNPTNSPYDTSFITDVAVKPGTHGANVLAVLGWRNGTDYNGFYLSTTGGGAGSFHKITPTGAIDTTDIGRTTLAYAGDGSRLYAIVQSPSDLLAGAATVLQGVFVSASGNPAGPYTKIADSTSLGASGSALGDLAGYNVGIQAWYNQALAVDPSNPMHIYVSLEEVFESGNGGKSFTTASPYWNYGLACGTSCPRTTHPDQHALATTAAHQVVIANDGGVYSRPMGVRGYGHWADLNATIHTLQYYDAAAGQAGPKQLGYWGGLQDNGTSFLRAGVSRNIEPAGGDGGYVLVDPANAQHAVGEYVDLAMYSTTDGGHTFTTISPECGSYTNAALCDPSARFIAPFQADIHSANHWVAAGNDVWISNRGFATRCATDCDWKQVHSFGLDANGGYNVGTALAMSGQTTYAAWVDASGNPSPSFASGIDTNYGGTWHRISSPVLPHRFIAGLTVDPGNAAHVYAVFNGYSRRWIPGGGQGTVFESTNGGATWHDLSGNLPDAPGDALAIVAGHLVLGTDIGLFTASATNPTRWSRVTGLPNVVVDNVRPAPGNASVVVATHGRGIWSLNLT